MAISTTTRLKTLLSVASSDTSQDSILTQVLAGAEGAVKTWCKRTFEQAVYTEYYSGSGQAKLCLRQSPAHYYNLTCGTITSGSAVITGISSTSSLIAGMPAVLPSYLPSGAVISSVDSATQVTLSAAATASGSSLAVHFGLSVWVDGGGFGGMGDGPFPSESLLYPGRDFYLERDQSDGTSKSAVLTRLGWSGVAGALGGFYLGGWGGGASMWGGGGGSLTARMPAVWPRMSGNIKAVYAAGYTSAAMPEDLKQAVDQLAVWLYRYGPSAGIMAGSESYEGYSYGLSVLRAEPELGETRRLLSAYRDVSI